MAGEDVVTLHGTEGELKVRLERPPVHVGLRLRRAMASTDVDLVGGAALYHASLVVRKNVRRHDQIARQGEAVIEWAVEAGVPEREWLEAGATALWLAVRELPALEVASSVAGFSAPTKDEKSG